MEKELSALIVDDEENARLYLAGLLVELYPEMTLHFASSPAEALFLLRQLHFSMVFMDVEMPGMSGLELQEQYLAKIELLPVIYVSGFKRPEFIQKALRLKAVDYLDKPVNPVELKDAVDKALQLFPSRKSGHTVVAHSTKICLPTEKGDLYFSPDEIACFESNKRNSFAYFADTCKKVVVRLNLVELMKVLPSGVFHRVSRQFIINESKIKYISKSTKSIVLNTHCAPVEVHKVYPDFFKMDH